MFDTAILELDIMENDNVGENINFLNIAKAILHQTPKRLNIILQGISSEEATSVLKDACPNNKNNLLHIAALHRNVASDIATATDFTEEITNASSFCDCLRILLQFCKHHDLLQYVDALNSEGETPLHFVMKKKCSRCINELLKFGARVNIRHNGEYTQFAKLINRNPSMIKYFIESLNKCITQPSCNSDICDFETNSDGNSEVTMDFRLIVSGNQGDMEPHREMEFIKTFLSVHRLIQKEIFSHPLVAAFVFMKWERTRKIFWLSLFVHIISAVLYTSHVFMVFLKNCPYGYRRQNNSLQMGSSGSEHVNIANKCQTGMGGFGSSMFLLCMVTLLGILELIKLLQNIKLYFGTWRNFFQIIMIVCMFLTVWPMQWTRSKAAHDWQYSAAAFGVFHVWSTLLINVGRFPRLGIYVEMLGKVSRNFGYFMIAYAFLLVGFTFAFCIVFPNYPPFQTPVRSVLQVITMMSGEVEYADFFYGKHDEIKKTDSPGNFFFTLGPSDLLHPATAHLLYGAFVVLVTIVLTNLLIGLAVDDIKALQQNAGLTQTTRGIDNIAYLESLIFSKKVPNFRFLQKLKNSLSLGNVTISKTTNFQKKDTYESAPNFCHRKFCKRIFSCFFKKRHALDSSTNAEIRHNLPRYTFIISYDDCKSGRQFPEEVFFKAVQIADVGQVHGSSDV